jgi:hypothetical protein
LTDQFLSVDSDVQMTDQSYAFTNDDPLNGTDPLGLCIRVLNGGCVPTPVAQASKSKAKPKSTTVTIKTGGGGTVTNVQFGNSTPVATETTPSGASQSVTFAASQNGATSWQGTAPPSTEGYFGNGGPGAESPSELMQTDQACANVSNDFIKDGTFVGGSSVLGGFAISAIGWGVGASAVETGGLSIALGGGVLIIVGITGGLLTNAVC